MRKRYTLLVMMYFVMLLLGGCSSNGSHDTARVESEGEIVETVLGDTVMHCIQGNLYYDTFTCIVYMRNTMYGGHTYCPYYAPNGLPYKYEAKTCTFKEIVFSELMQECIAEEEKHE